MENAVKKVIPVSAYLASKTNFDLLKKQIRSKKVGTMFKIRYKKDLPVAKEYSSRDIQVVKVTDMQVRVGINYSHMASTVAKVGELRDVGEKLKYGNWIAGEEKYFLEYTKKDGSYHRYLRVYPNPKGVAKARYFIRMDGKSEFCEVSADYIRYMGLVSESNLASKESSTLNLDVDKILTVW